MNFNFGEHFYLIENSALIYDLGITFFGAFLGLLAAFLVNREIDKKEIKKEVKNKEKKYLSHLEYLSQLLDLINKNYKKQAENYKKLSLTVKNKPLETHLPDLLATYDLPRIKNIDSNELRDAYFYFFSINKERIEDYRKLFSNIDFLLMKFDDLIKQNENHRNFIYKNQLFVFGYVEEISLRLGIRLKNIEKLNSEKFQNISEISYLEKYINLFNEISKNHSDFQTYLESYLKPLHDTILDEVSDTNFADEIFILLRKSVYRLKNMEYNSKEFAKDMETVESEIQNTIKFLTETCILIKNKTSHSN